ncbi:hypothetical protein APHAL10511_005379 [Amanita phalloides]|nr:hypothetical protein APHAL10511_005379 [Amanita phalloides]
MTPQFGAVTLTALVKTSTGLKPPNILRATTSNPTRGTSAPPPSSTARIPAQSTMRGTVTTTRAVSGPTRSRGPATEDKRFNDLQTQLKIHAAANSARLAADMEAERVKVAELGEPYNVVARAG